MALAEQAELVATMRLKDGFSMPAAKMQKGLKGLSVDTTKARQGFAKVGEGLKKGFTVAALGAAAGIAFLGLQIRSGIASLAESETLNKRTAAVIKSTGGAAHVSAEQVSELASSYEDLTTIDDKVIQGGENLLLTFTKIRKDAFEPALAAALDMSSALGTDLNGAITQVGKALSDPIKGISALTRVGVVFSESQKAVIKRLVETGHSAKAQQLILRELNREFGGQAAADADGYAGAQRRLADAVEDSQRSLATGLLPALTNVSRKLAGFLKRDDVQGRIKEFGKSLAGLVDDFFGSAGTDGGDALTRNLKLPSRFEQTISSVADALGKVPFDQIRDTLSAGLAVTKEAATIFNGLPPEVKGGLITLLAANKLTGGLVSSGLRDLAGFALSSLKTITAANVTVVGANVTGPGGGNSLPTPPGKTAPTGGGGLLNDILNGIVRGGATSAAIAVATAETSSRIDALRAQNADYIGRQLNSSAQMAGALQRASEHEATLARLAPVHNDILDGIAADTSAELGATRTLRIPLNAIRPGLDRIQSATSRVDRSTTIVAAKTAQWGVATVGKIDQLANRSAQYGVATIGAIRGTTAAVNRKDLSVRVSTTLQVSAREVASALTTTYGGHRFVD